MPLGEPINFIVKGYSSGCIFVLKRTHCYYRAEVAGVKDLEQSPRDHLPVRLKVCFVIRRPHLCFGLFSFHEDVPSLLYPLILGNLTKVGLV